MINNNGSAVADLYTLFSVVSETDLSVFTVTNLKNGQKMQISSGLSAGDVVIIDSETKLLQKRRGAGLPRIFLLSLNLVRIIFS